MKKATVWYPYAQMQLHEERHKVVKGSQEFLQLENGKTLIDGVSSWWAAIHGYNHPELNDALVKQSQKFSHVMLGGLTHDPVQKFANKLVEITPDGLQHVFFSDSGSVGVEVALKMAIQYWSNKGNTTKQQFVSLENAYHGDTFKTMEVGDDSDYQKAYSSVLNKGYYTPIPLGGLEASMNQLQVALDKFESILIKHANTIAAFIVEPLMQGAAGFQLYCPKYLSETKKLCEKYNILFIADEVATGFGRTGKLFACNHANITPDILILGKALTGGYLGHAATIATSEVFDAFLGESYEQALMHGPTFMGNPLACSVGLKNIQIFERDNYLSKVKYIEQNFQKAFNHFTHNDIVEIRIFGCMLVIETKNESCLDGFKQFAINEGIWLRPIGKFLYATPPYIISEESLNKIISTLKKWFTLPNRTLIMPAN